MNNLGVKHKIETWGEKEGRGIQLLKRLAITQLRIWWKMREMNPQLLTPVEYEKYVQEIR
jgi:hypothetical protein